MSTTDRSEVSSTVQVRLEFNKAGNNPATNQLKPLAMTERMGLSGLALVRSVERVELTWPILLSGVCPTLVGQMAIGQNWQSSLTSGTSQSKPMNLAEERHSHVESQSRGLKTCPSS